MSLQDTESEADSSLIDFIFFHQKPYTLFIEFLQTQQVELTTQVDTETFQVSISEDIEDDLFQRVEIEYEKLFDMNQSLVEAEEAINATSGTNLNNSGLIVNLKDGTKTYARIDPSLMARLLQSVSAEELGELVNAIVDAVENPQDGTLCEIEILPPEN